jgi:hypothetical protein
VPSRFSRRHFFIHEFHELKNDFQILIALGMRGEVVASRNVERMFFVFFMMNDSVCGKAKEVRRGTWAQKTGTALAVSVVDSELLFFAVKPQKSNRVWQVIALQIVAQ